MKELNGLTDEELAILYVKGNNKAFDILLARTQNKLFAYIMFMVHDQSVADDIFQETFIKVITKLHAGEYATTGKFLGWCMRIAHNVVMDLYRDRKTEHIVDAPVDNDLCSIRTAEMIEDNIESLTVKRQIREDVCRMMNMLPVPQREVVYMRFYQRLSFKEIADMTNVSINTSLGRMHYAIINLRRMAKEHNVQLQAE